nr:immunoglobulin light chain junction region [Macaca mulatta]MOW29869.1 immunoglobulin light chain junction region [Macaca mulatta]MOW29974.1 immunoglobulin light chain junction region [Macaca mulatta]MOW30170.1 immunoglobulin light chain junction region [Macaca mulatta]MOW30313.1 immunoglobulin light chain junction region [Macaca mulatta]
DYYCSSYAGRYLF